MINNVCSNSKKLVGMTVLGIVVVGGWVSIGWAQFTSSTPPDYSWYGNGSAMIFTVSTPAQLLGFANIVNGTTGGTPARSDFSGKTVNMTVDIDLNNVEWEPIGNGANLGGSPPIYARFVGTFDGGGNVVSGLYVSGNSDTRGLFGIIDLGGTVKNLGVYGSVAGSRRVGGVVGDNYRGTVSNCHNNSDVTSTFGLSGGIVGSNSGLVLNCYNTGKIINTAGSSNGSVGGVVGSNFLDSVFSGAAGSRAIVSSCYNVGDIVSSGVSIGGIVGSNTLGTVSNCYNAGNVSGLAEVGGVVGLNESIYNYNKYAYDGLVLNCYNIGNVRGNNRVGGILGSPQKRTSWTGIVDGRTEDNVSLGLKVTSNDNRIGRVGGVDGSGTPLRGNKARADIIIDISGSESIPTSNIEANRINGADILLGTSLASVFSGWDIGIWNIPSGNLIEEGVLPTLKTITQVPAPILPKQTICIITISANAIVGGTVSGGGTATIGERATVTAYPNAEYDFVNWTEGGVEVSSDIAYEFTATASRTLVANFTLKTYTITFVDWDGTILATQTNIPHGTAATAPTEPTRSGYIFANWDVSFANVTSDLTVTAQWTLIPIINAVPPTITTQSSGGTITAETVRTLSVSANSSDGGTLSYQWYSNTTASNSGGTAISGATSATYTPSTATAGTYYYYVVVTNTNNSVNGNKTATTTSYVVTLLVEPTVSILESGRTIPAVYNKDAAVIVPTEHISFELSVGPNPVERDGKVRFFVAGKSFTNGTLTIYNATGNVIRRISITDNVAIGNQARREIGSWDLKDTKNKIVSSGTYLVRGTISTVDGKRERVSLILEIY